MPLKLKNTEKRFGLVAVSLHWLIAILISSMLALGLYMTNFPKDAEKFQLYGWHKAFGILALGLIVLRVIWRLINITPQLYLPRLEKIAAYAMHWSLYVVMMAMPLTGWLMSSAAGRPVSFFGLFTLPNLMQPNKAWQHFFASAHGWLAYALIAMIIIHTLAALKHYFIDKDDILQRML